MSAIGPGDWVEALNDENAGGGCMALRKGGLYQVRAFDEGAGDCSNCGHSGDGIWLVGDSVRAFASWCPVCALRPIYRPKADLIESLKTPAKREGVPA